MIGKHSIIVAGKYRELTSINMRQLVMHREARRPGSKIYCAINANVTAVDPKPMSLIIPHIFPFGFPIIVQ